MALCKSFECACHRLEKNSAEGFAASNSVPYSWLLLQDMVPQNLEFSHLTCEPEFPRIGGRIYRETCFWMVNIIVSCTFFLNTLKLGPPRSGQFFLVETWDPTQGNRGFFRRLLSIFSGFLIKITKKTTRKGGRGGWIIIIICFTDLATWLVFGGYIAESINKQSQFDGFSVVMLVYQKDQVRTGQSNLAVKSLQFYPFQTHRSPDHLHERQSQEVGVFWMIPSKTSIFWWLIGFISYVSKYLLLKHHEMVTIVLVTA